MLSPTIKGNIAVGQAIAYFSHQGYAVYTPLSDCAACIDLVVSPDDRAMLRVQCKYTSKLRDRRANQQTTTARAVYRVDLRPSGLRMKALHYTPASFDLLFLSCPTGNYLVDWPEFCRHRATNSIPPKVILLGVSMEPYKVGNLL